MSMFLPKLESGWHVDQAILAEESRVVVIRFGHDWDPECMVHDETLFKIAEKVKNMAVIYTVDITQVPDFNKMYELYDACTTMFFYRQLLPLFLPFSAPPPTLSPLTSPATSLAHINDARDSKLVLHSIDARRNKHIMIDLGTGNNNKINWGVADQQELIDIIETVYRGASKGRGLVVSPRDYSTRLRY
ncbi:Thioredoxin-like protein 4A [Rhodotorula toruloides]|nr:Thioredoxin-like protein 4A [Rhodotorula toruloides]